MLVLNSSKQNILPTLLNFPKNPDTFKRLDMNFVPSVNKACTCVYTCSADVMLFWQGPEIWDHTRLERKES